MSKIVLEHGFAYYEKMSASHCKIEIQNENQNWIELVNQNEKIPFAIDKGEKWCQYNNKAENRPK